MALGKKSVLAICVSIRSEGQGPEFLNKISNHVSIDPILCIFYIVEPLALPTNKSCNSKELSYFQM